MIPLRVCTILMFPVFGNPTPSLIDEPC